MLQKIMPTQSWVTEPRTFEAKLERLRIFQELYPQILAAIERIVAREAPVSPGGTTPTLEGKPLPRLEGLIRRHAPLSPGKIAREMGMPSQTSMLFQILRHQPRLRAVIYRFNRVMGPKYPQLVTDRIKERAKVKAAALEKEKLRMIVANHPIPRAPMRPQRSLARA